MSMSCSTWTIALTPRRRAAPTMTSMMACLSAVLAAEVGSSSRISSGPSANALATSSSFLSPWGNVRASLASRSARPKTAAISPTSAWTARSAARDDQKRRPRPRRAQTATASVSATVRAGKTLTSWKLRARPRRASVTGPAPTMSRPRKLIWPAVGGASPVTMLTSVVLPAPLGPMIETNSPSLTVRLTPSSAVKSPERFVRPRASSRTLTCRRAGADREEAEAERRADGPPHDDRAEDEHGERVVVERAGEELDLAERRPGQAEEPRAEDPHALVAAGHRVELEQERIEEHPEGQRQHAEVDPHVAHAEQAGRQRDHRPGPGRGHQDHLEVQHAELRGQERGGVGTERHEQGVTEGEQAGRAEEEIQAEERDAVAEERQH